MFFSDISMPFSTCPKYFFYHEITLKDTFISIITIACENNREIQFLILMIKAPLNEF